MNELTFGFFGHDYNEPADIGQILHIAEKLESKLRYTSFDTGGTFYDYAILNGCMEALSEKERALMPQFFHDVLLGKDVLEGIHLKKEDVIYTIDLKDYRVYVDKVSQEEEDWV